MSIYFSIDDVLNSIEKLKSFLDSSNSLLVAAGAGMGVDSGLPDFRGKEGFWNVYPHWQSLE